MQKREPKHDDQEMADVSFRLIQNCVLKNFYIESSIWVSGCWFALIDCCIRNNMDYKTFCKELDGVKKHYKKCWNEKNGGSLGS